MDPLHNVSVEQALLGAILIDNQLIEHVSDFLKPYHFSSSFHGVLFDTLLKFHEKGQAADPLTLKAILSRHPDFDEAYVINLVNHVLSLHGAAEYGRIIYDLYLRRQLMLLGDSIKDEAKDVPKNVPVNEQIEQAEKKLFDLSDDGKGSSQAISFNQALIQAIHSAELAFKKTSHVVGITTGLRDLDGLLGGFHPSDLVIIAGRPSMGKTAFATNVAFNAAKAYANNVNEGANVLFFSLEMSSEQLALRVLSSESNVSSDLIRRGKLTNDQFTQIMITSREINSMGLFIDDSPGISITTLRNRARRMKRLHNIGLIVIDYLQLLEGSGYKGGDNRVQEISEISRGLKAVAKELHVPVIALSQLSRAVEQREDKRPQLSDLRESGSIEQDADVVMFVYRAEYYESRKEPQEGTDKHVQWMMEMNKIQNKAEVIIAKQRHGPIGIVPLYFDGKLTKFANLGHT